MNLKQGEITVDYKETADKDTENQSGRGSAFGPVEYRSIYAGWQKHEAMMAAANENWNTIRDGDWSRRYPGGDVLCRLRESARVGGNPGRQLMLDAATEIERLRDIVRQDGERERSSVLHRCAATVADVKKAAVSKLMANPALIPEKAKVIEAECHRRINIDFLVERGWGMSFLEGSPNEDVADCAKGELAGVFPNCLGNVWRGVVVANSAVAAGYIGVKVDNSDSIWSVRLNRLRHEDAGRQWQGPTIADPEDEEDDDCDDAHDGVAKILPSLAGTDSWHYSNYFGAKPAIKMSEDYRVTTVAEVSNKLVLPEPCSCSTMDLMTGGCKCGGK